MKAQRARLTIWRAAVRSLELESMTAPDRLALRISLVIDSMPRASAMLINEINGKTKAWRIFNYDDA